MKIPRKSFICFVLTLAMLVAPSLAPAQSSKWWQSEKYQKELALTADQITRLEAIFQTTGPTLRAQKTALEKSEQKLSKVISDTTSDEARVLQAAERAEAIRTELSKTRTLMLFRMRRILTDEQNVKMKALHERDHDRDRRPKGDQSRDHEPACPSA